MISVATLMTWASLSLMPLPATINVQLSGPCPFAGMTNKVACATSPDNQIYFEPATGRLSLSAKQVERILTVLDGLA